MTLRRPQRREKKNNIPRVLSTHREIDRYQKVWVISDVHSCFHTLRRLLEQLAPFDGSLFVFLGDYINKGAFPLETVSYLSTFARSRDCLFLRGNHDQMLLDAWQLSDDIYKNQIISLGSGVLLEHKTKFRDFFLSTLHYVETERFFLVHAGFDFASDQPFEDVERMMMIRAISYDADKARNKKIIRGHYPTSLEQIKQDVGSRSNVIALDNGCVYPEREDMGNLVALELHSWELVIQQNVD